jgi:Na+-driven multidrug efflux pump
MKKKNATILASVAAAFTFFFGLFLLLTGIYEETQKDWYGWYFGIVSIIGMLISISCPYIVYSKVFDYLDK